MPDAQDDDGKGGSDTATVDVDVEAPLGGVVARELRFDLGLQYFMRAEGKTEWIELDSFQFGLSHPEDKHPGPI
jgi:hypothetical protein